MPGRKGSILIITLWILAILVVFSLGLARRAALNLRIASYQRDKMQAGYLARAGVNQAIQLLKKEFSAYDTRENCGISLGTRQAQDVFSKKWGEGANDGFKIGFIAPSGDFAYGFQDEESRINLNGLGQSGLSLLNTEALLKELCRIKNIDDYDSLAKKVAEWISPGASTVGNKAIKKGTDFCRQEELLAALENFYAVSGQKDSEKNARQVYNDLEDAITVFAAKLNVNTASEDVLTAAICSAAGLATNGAAAANTLADKIKDYRSGSVFDAQGLETFDTRDTDANALFVSLKPYLTCKSEYFRFTVVGLYRGASKEITVVYHRPNLANSNGKIVYWHER